MSVEEQVVAAATARAAALAAGDGAALEGLLHPGFRWSSHVGDSFDRASYVAANTGGGTRWTRQQIVDAEVVVAGDTAVLRATVIDEVDRGDGPETYRMPMTQVWVRTGEGWLCLAGHAGPRLAD